MADSSTGNRPRGPRDYPKICLGCGLELGVGHRDRDGAVTEPDTAPSDDGIDTAAGWFCTRECADYYANCGDEEVWCTEQRLRYDIIECKHAVASAIGARTRFWWLMLLADLACAVELLDREVRSM